MGRIIAIDYGRKRTGLAVTDPLRMIAGGLDTVPVGRVVAWLEHYVANEPVDCIVVGCPAMLDGSESETMAKYVAPFVKRLKKAFPSILIDTLDERFTSKMAVRAMVDGGMKKKDRSNKGNIDKISATILLQDYLESRRGKESSTGG